MVTPHGSRAYNNRVKRFESWKKLKSIVEKVEWSGRSRGQGTGFMSSGNDGPLVRSCSWCGGIDPTDGNRGHFGENVWGHKEDCKLKVALEEANDID